MWLIKQDRMEELNGSLLDLSHAGSDIITKILGSMPPRDRFVCALVCKAWLDAAKAATNSIALRYHRIGDDSSLQHWLEKHGNRLEVLQLHDWYGTHQAALACCAKLKDLLLHGPTYILCQHYGQHSVAHIASGTWGYIATATRLTSLSLSHVQTECQQADVVAALTALPNLEQLTWRDVTCNIKQQLYLPSPKEYFARLLKGDGRDSKQPQLADSSLLQQLTQLTSLELRGVTAEGLRHLGSLSKLQRLSISGAEGWAAAGCPGLRDLKAQSLTSLTLAKKKKKKRW